MQILLNIIHSSMIYLLVSISFSLLYYSSKIFNLNHAIILTSGAYLTFLFTKLLMFPMSISIILSILFASLIGMCSYYYIFSFMLRNKVPEWSYFIVSIGLYVISQNFISICFGDDAKAFPMGYNTLGHEIFGAYMTTIQVITIFTSFVLFSIVNLFLQFTKNGKTIRAVSNNPVLCNIYGINSNKIILVCFGMASGIGAIAGLLSAMDTNMTPTLGFNLLLYGVVVMIIGGLGSTKGLIVGSFLVASAQHLGAYYIDTKWMDAIAFIILILFLIWKPLGFSGMRLKKVEV